jgi:hypothetical protein
MPRIAVRGRFIEQQGFTPPGEAAACPPRYGALLFQSRSWAGSSW